MQAQAIVPAQQPAARGVDRGVAAQAVAASAVDAPAAPANFTVDCPPAWELVGDLAEAEAQWACRSESALPDGFFPNCNVMSGPAQAGAALEAYLDFADDPAEHTWVANRLSERATKIGNVAAHELVYDYEIANDPLRVLATAVVHAANVYVLTCSAAPGAFGRLESTFRSIIGSFRIRESSRR